MAFSVPTVDDITEYLARIGKKEKLKIENEALELIAENAHGDFRPAVTALQMSVQNISGEKLVTAKRVSEIFNFMTAESVEKIIKFIATGDPIEAVHLVDSYLASGITAEDIVNRLYKYCDAKNLFEGDNGIEFLKSFAQIGSILAASTLPQIAMTYFIKGPLSDNRALFKG
jgi:DNA polymerase III gamma/tau subunit